MPLLIIESLSTDVRLGLWAIEESEDDILRDYPSLTTIVDKGMRSQARRLERLAVAALVSEMTGIACPQIRHRENGAPVIEGFHISISHTKGYAAVILSESREVAVDIEYWSDRVERIAAKFIRDDELWKSIEHLLLTWCAKETMYKFYSDNHLALHDIKIEQIEEANSNNGSIRCCNMQNGDKKTIFYRIDKNTVLTYLA